jgi:hypothetical protein
MTTYDTGLYLINRGGSLSSYKRRRVGSSPSSIKWKKGNLYHHISTSDAPVDFAPFLECSRSRRTKPRLEPDWILDGFVMVEASELMLLNGKILKDIDLGG